MHDAVIQTIRTDEYSFVIQIYNLFHHLRFSLSNECLSIRIFLYLNKNSHMLLPTDFIQIQSFGPESRITENTKKTKRNKFSANAHIYYPIHLVSLYKVRKCTSSQYKCGLLDLHRAYMVYQYKVPLRSTPL